MEDDRINHSLPAPSSLDLSGRLAPPQDRRLVITKMKATNLFTRLGQIPTTSSLQYISASLRQIPAGFYVNIFVENKEYKTANKSAIVVGGMAEWEDHIYLPSDLSSVIELHIYASSELGPMLGRGELLQKISITVGELVQRSNTSRQLYVLPEDRDVVFSWPFLQVTVQPFSPQDTNAIVLCSPVSAEPDEAQAVAEATDIGHAHMVRYCNDVDESHINDAITQFYHVLDRCPLNHLARSAALSNLAMAKFISSQATGVHLDLDVAIFLFQDARDLRPRDHPDHPSTLLKLAVALLSRFNKRGDATDADEAQKLLDSVLDICSPASLEYRSAVLIAQTHSMRSGANDVVEPNATMAVSSTQSASQQSPFSVDELSRKREQCEQQDDPELLDDVISQHRDALSFSVPGQSDWFDIKCGLAKVLVLRFERQGRKQDLEEAILSHREILLWTSRERAAHCFVLNNLASDLWTRLENGGDRKDLDESIQLNRDALALLPPGHPFHVLPLNNIANALMTRFEQDGDREDLEEAIQYHRDALATFPPGHQHRAGSLNNIANALQRRFEQGGDRKDLDEAIQLLQDALELTPPGHPHRAILLNSTASALNVRFSQGGDMKDLEDTIQLHRDALVLRPPGHSLRASSLNNVASAVGTRFEQRGDRKDLNEAIQLNRDALVLTPPGHTLCPLSLNNLASVVGTRFEQSGDRKDLDEAIQLRRDALVLTPPGHSLRATLLNNISGSLKTRFEQGGDRKDLEEVIQHCRNALVLTPPGHPFHPVSLRNLAMALETQFEQGGDRKDLDKAIQLNQDALVLTPLGHPLHAISLSSISSALKTRFDHSGNRKDLDEAIQLNRDALMLRPPGHPLRATSLNNIGTTLQTRFHQGGDRKDLEEAIQFHQDALVLTPPGHQYHARSLNNIANGLMKQFELDGDRKDLERAIQHHQDALVLTPPGHPFRATLLNNIATTFMTMFQQGGNRKDLEEAIQHDRDALVLRPLGQTDHVISLNNLVTVLLMRFRHYGDSKDLEEALQLCHMAKVESPSSHPIQDAEDHQHSSVLDAYARTLELLDSHLSATASVSARHQTRMNFPTNLSADAASCALCYGDICRALELLEQGRTMLWTQMARFRTPLDQLGSIDSSAEALIQRFQHLSFMLNQQPADGLSTQNSSKFTPEAEARLHRDLVEEWNMVVAQIRTFKGFSRFLLPPLFSDLQEASCDGPVIVLIANKFSCDAVIVLHKQSPIHIHLETTLKTLTTHTHQFRKEIFNLKEEYLSFTRNDQQETSLYTEFTPEQSEVLAETLKSLHLQSKREISNSIIKILRNLWTTVVFPVVIELEKVGIQKGSRIWWCPSSIFTALPLHATGPYRSGQRNLENFYISSYTPSLSTLIKARQMRDSSSSVSTHFAAIVQAKPAGHQTALFYPDQEASMIGHLLSSPHPAVFTKLTSATSTTDAALDALQKNLWIHFSCHGFQNFAEPFKSSLKMLNGSLSLLDIINSDLSSHEFVYLSACQTAVGDIKTPDEMIHLAAGLQFGGVKSVIGTQWSVHDGVAYLLASEFYKEFCVGGVMDCTRAAKALHQALQSLKRQKIPLRERIMFVHIGI
ncbi:hypothetical protein BDN67DRAFT_1001504 [Paxillus ammoniavirescens]|nr:hypothetical protein BDN67DRAFT_1001504 [Paxillus ammoniavirescens]